MKVKELKTGLIHRAFQTMWVDEGDGCSPGTRVDTFSYTGDGEPLTLLPGEWEEVGTDELITGNEVGPNRKEETVVLRSQEVDDLQKALSAGYGTYSTR